MKITGKTIEELSLMVTGDSEMSPYLTGPQLVDLFNQFGSNETYYTGFPTRRYYAEDKIKELNNSDQLRELILNILDPRNFINTEFNLEKVVCHLNQFLRYDDYQIVRSGKSFKIKRIGEPLIHTQSMDKLGNEYINNELRKCENKINEGDFDGAITNARSLLETVLLELEIRISKEEKEYDGDLIKLYRRVQKLMNLEPSRTDISNSLKQLLSGMVSIVNGISSIRNKMSDAHGKTYKPSKHHAKLATNAVNTLGEFLVDTYNYQISKIT